MVNARDASRGDSGRGGDRHQASPEGVTRAVLVPIGIAVCATGISLPFTMGDDAIVSVVSGMSNLFVAIGTLLVTFAVTQVDGQERAIRILRPRLESICDHLLTAVSLVRNHIDQGRSDQLGAEQAIVAMADSSIYLSASVRDLEMLTGRQADYESTITEALARVQRLSDALTDTTLGARDADGSAEQVRLIQAELSELRRLLAAPRSPSATGTETVQCPHCGAATRTVLGTMPGDSALPSCPECRTKFHVHRLADASVTTRMWGSGSGPSPERLEVHCPNPACHETMLATVRPGDTASRPRWCVSCYWRFSVNPETGAVLEAKPDTPVEVVRGDGPSALVMICPLCNREVKPFYQRAETGERFATCYVCSRLLRQPGPAVSAAAGAATGAPASLEP